MRATVSSARSKTEYNGSRCAVQRLFFRKKTMLSKGIAAACEFAGAARLSNRVLRDCTPRALPRAARSGRHVGLRPPRNDNSGAFAILTAVCTDCKCVTGPGCPLPYNGRCGRRSATKPAACKALRERRYRRKLPKCSRAGYRGRRTGRSWQWGRALCRAAFSTGNGRRQGPPAQEASGYPAQGHHRGA